MTGGEVPAAPAKIATVKTASAAKVSPPVQSPVQSPVKSPLKSPPKSPVKAIGKGGPMVRDKAEAKDKTESQTRTGAKGRSDPDMSAQKTPGGLEE